MRTIRVTCLWLVLLIRNGSCTSTNPLDDLLRAILGNLPNGEVATNGTNETALTSTTLSSIQTSHVTSLVTSPPTSTTSRPTTSMQTTAETANTTDLGEMTSHTVTKCFDLHCYYRGCLRNETNATDAGGCNTTSSSNPCFVTFVGSDTYTRVTAGCNNGSIVCDNNYSGEGFYLRWTKCCSTNHCNDNENYVYQGHDMAGRLTSFPPLVLAETIAVYLLMKI